MSGPRDPELERALREHGQALAATDETLRKVDAADWQRPLFSGKWSPAQITEHLVLVYQRLDGELSGDDRMRNRLEPWQQNLIRWFLLPFVLLRGVIPRGAASPRELRPSAEGLPYAGARQLLAEAGRSLEQRLREERDPPPFFNHPYFGRLPAPRTLRFCAIHLEHHRRQIAEALVRRSGSPPSGSG